MIETWVLIGVFVYDGYKAGGVAVLQQEFNSEASCIEVRDYLRSQKEHLTVDIDTLRCYKK